jgi:hypothetical protein
MAFTAETKYSAIVEDNLFNDSVLQPGKTYTTRWQGDAATGVVSIPKLTKGTALTDGSGITSVFDLTSGGLAATQLSLLINTPFSMSTPIYKLQMQEVTYDVAKEQMELNTKIITESWNKAGMDALIAGGTPNATAALPTTGDEFQTAFLADRKTLRNAGAKPRVMVASVTMYNLMLSDTTNFTPTFNDDKIKMGIVGRYYGVDVFEYQDFGVVAAKEVGYVLYDQEAFACASNIETARMVDGAPNIIGVFAQTALNSGFLVTNAERVIVKTSNV